MPFADEVKRFDGRILTLDSETQRYFTVDKKPLNVDSYVKWRIKDVALYYTATSGDERNASDRLAERVRTGSGMSFPVAMSTRLFQGSAMSSWTTLPRASPR